MIIHLYIYMFYVWICQHDKLSISAPYYQTPEQWYLEALSLIEFHACLESVRSCRLPDLIHLENRKNI